ncbi:uncharacterized protein LOC143623726 [Bidens hawaiensis]|uniref:uncharacterized protein LOC143623726 n=1 Tax=Bidens hawaiensis TaxID=980011 RepID=UPI00404AEE25
MREWFAFMFQDRVGQFSHTLYSRRLLQQILVDAFTMIESERLCFIRTKQKELRSVTFENLKSLKNKGCSDVSKVGQRIILPSSFTGGARYMMQNYLDAMTLCKWYGYPDFFITVTCNPKWAEVQRFLKDTTLNADDRPDILCRMFKIKLDSLIKDLKENHVLGKLQAVVYTVEFQKRGLPHAHLCLFMQKEDKLPNVEHVDPYINNKCTKNFPKNFQDETSVDTDGFPLYRRRDNGAFVQKSDIKLDSRSVVPYNIKLLKRYQAHINVEWCNQGSSIKYLFKYINKGPDRATMYFANGGEGKNNEDRHIDEIKEFYDCRYLSACEASWRIFAYDVHYRVPAVMRLPFHLPGKQQVIYGTNDDIENVLEKTDTVSSSMFEL